MYHHHKNFIKAIIGPDKGLIHDTNNIMTLFYNNYIELWNASHFIPSQTQMSILR